MKKMLIESNSSEVKVAIIEGHELIRLDLDYSFSQQRKTNIYRARIKSIEASLNAFFINYGDEKDGFLPFKCVNEFYTCNKNPEDALSIGQELIVQMKREAFGNKCACFTTFIDLAGCYLVLQCFKNLKISVSNSILEPNRSRIKNLLSYLEIPVGMSVIARTSSEYCTLAQLQSDLNNILDIWQSICNLKVGTIGLIYKSNDILTRSVRDMLTEDITSIVVNSSSVEKEINKLLRIFKKNTFVGFALNKNLFDYYGIRQQYEQAFSSNVRLKSGGSIIIIENEAMTCIDVNSSRYRSGSNLDETAFFINKEAAAEIARQLRIRNIGGIVVIDFIEMSNADKNDELESYLVKELSKDTAIMQVVKMSPLGLVELSRQYLASSIKERLSITCSRCDGLGYEKSFDYFRYTVLSALKDYIIKKNSRNVYLYLSSEYYSILLNDKDIKKISSYFKRNIKIINREDIFGQNFDIKDKLVSYKDNLVLRKDNAQDLSYIDESVDKNLGFFKQFFKSIDKIFKSIFAWLSYDKNKKSNLRNNYSRKVKIKKSLPIIFSKNNEIQGENDEKSYK